MNKIANILFGIAMCFAGMALVCCCLCFFWIKFVALVPLLMFAFLGLMMAVKVVGGCDV